MPEVEELVPEAELLPALSVKEDESPLRFPELLESIIENVDLTRNVNMNVY